MQLAQQLLEILEELGSQDLCAPTYVSLAVIPHNNFVISSKYFIRVLKRSNMRLTPLCFD